MYQVQSEEFTRDLANANWDIENALMNIQRREVDKIMKNLE